MGTRTGSIVSEKGAETECDTGLGLRMQPNKPFGRNKTMVMPHHHQHLSGTTAAFGLKGCCGDGGPLFCDSSNQVSSTSHIYDIVGASLLPKTPHHTNSATFSFDSSGGMVNVRVPFTAAQRQELERQTMIYKYMMASAPVPPQLLLPITNTPSNFAHLHSNQVKGSLELGISNSSDPEPWRCRRTDGKKWRCSRDVIPDQKYCERHSHKSRPRSRKHVESQPHLITGNIIHNNSTMPYSKPPFVNHQTPFCTSMVSTTFASSHDQPRCLEWFVKGETVPVDGLNQESNAANMDITGQQHQVPFNLYTEYADADQTHRELNDQCSPFLTPKLSHFEGALSSSKTQETRHFIDAWSSAEREQISNRCSVPLSEKLPASSLSLSMCGGYGTYEEESSENIDQMGHVDMKSQWMMSSVSWLGSPPGGPLAEALCLGISGSTRAESSPGRNSSSIGTSSSTRSS
ncbi:hypothetical protein FNV43_RR25283 [Rhamnella rubrinervis]|uniref:Growth-regulating factor n=1 Tax=Rhamnella rubrinervis TaxID=2594499 RepID=A0A8K0DNB6_9ROSA|nr:hypothetical protein FNV43_RR25283 [Rhamnella rubrinervis]